MVCGSVVFEMDVDKSGKETILFALMNQVNLLQTVQMLQKILGQEKREKLIQDLSCELVVSFLFGF